MKIRRVSYIDAKNFIKTKWLIAKPTYEYYALCDKKDQLVSIIAISINDKAKVIKLHANFTPKENRGNGYFTTLLWNIIKCCDGYKIIADCTEYSKGIYEKAGFIQKSPTKQRKYFQITRMEYIHG